MSLRLANMLACVSFSSSPSGHEVVQLYRYPGLTESKARTLLRKAHEKASTKITGIDGELVRLRQPHVQGVVGVAAWTASLL